MNVPIKPPPPIAAYTITSSGSILLLFFPVLSSPSRRPGPGSDGEGVDIGGVIPG